MDATLSLEAKKIIRLIVDDIVKGQVPTGLTAFSQLHDYVDANEYLIEAGLDYADDEDIRRCNMIVEEVSDWLYHHKTYRRRELRKPVI